MARWRRESPDDMSAGEVAREFGVGRDVPNRWARGNLIPSTKDEKGLRHFKRGDVAKTLKAIGDSKAGSRKSPGLTLSQLRAEQDGAAGRNQPRYPHTTFRPVALTDCNYHTMVISVPNVRRWYLGSFTSRGMEQSHGFTRVREAWQGRGGTSRQSQDGHSLGQGRQD